MLCVAMCFLCLAIFCYAFLCFAMTAMFYYVLLCFAMFYHVLLSFLYVLLCFAMFYFVFGHSSEPSGAIFVQMGESVFRSASRTF